jgi:hypothetical protein
MQAARIFVLLDHFTAVAAHSDQADEQVLVK